MKYALLSLCLTFSLIGYAQKRVYTLADTPMHIDTLTGAMTYNDVVRCDSVAAETLFERASLFLVRTFANSGSVANYADPKSGVVSGRGRVLIDMPAMKQAILGGQVYYEMAIEIRVKPGRYRYEFSNIEIVNGTNRVRIDDALRKNPKTVKRALEKTYTEKEYEKYMGDSNPAMLLARQLKQAMNPKTDKNDF